MALELLLRLFVGFDPGYYVAFEKPRPGATLVYPYGEIPINGHGFPDGEWSATKSKPRVGYVGDSIAYGLGAGYGHRISEILETELPGYEHLNFGKPGWFISPESISEVVERAESFELDHVVYLMNLNDIVADLSREQRAQRQQLLESRHALRAARKLAEELRGRSYLYTYLRNLIKSRTFRRGYRSDGHAAYELSPLEYLDVVLMTAARVRKLNDDLTRRGVSLTVVLLPYEMQISREAEERYHELGVRWDEESFIDRGPQRILERRLPRVRLLDAYWAFVDPSEAEASRAGNAVGAYFVYDRGDRIDFNHPNRAGHRRIADFLLREGLTKPAPAGRPAGS